ncbi:ABC transporter ATP-binding protein [Nonlabens spongiae]|uniref:ABC transporter ATP-binding protein n=1 Tax=Nonlabens spongiae TaxID=331648 RepID=UPI001B8030A1|nr:ABC transporter ATP-binding protein [Nonlabens spongiae]
MDALLDIQNITKSFGTEKVLDNVTFQLAEHEVLSVLGKSGSGKTTLLKILAGLEREDSGEITLSRKRMNDTPPNKRNIVYLYQEPLLFPHLNIEENVAFGLRIRKQPKGQITAKVAEMLEEIGLSEHAKKMPHQLSGGQRQRVSFARALVINPKVLLLDEPFGALDSETRTQMQQLFKRVSAKYRLTSLFITHDLKEALIMGDHIGKIEKGVFKKYKSQEEFYNDETSGVRQEAEFWKQFNP